MNESPYPQALQDILQQRGDENSRLHEKMVYLLEHDYKDPDNKLQN